MECNFGVLKDSAFLSTKILKIIEINNFFSKKINNLAKQLHLGKNAPKIQMNDQAHRLRHNVGTCLWREH